MKQLIADFKRLNRVSVIASILVGIGVLLWMFVSKSFIIIAAAGAFGPGLLREVGWIDDHDDYQRHLARRSGYHAYLFTGLLISIFAFILVLDGQSVDAVEIVNFLLLTSWLAWMFSSLMAFWGARKTTSRILIVFGAFWALFVLANFISPDVSSDTTIWESIMGFLFGVLLIALFFVPAWAAHSWPRVTGWILLLAGAGLAFLLSGGSNFSLTTRLMTNTMLMVPLIICGVALILEARNLESEREEEIPDGVVPSS